MYHNQDAADQAEKEFDRIFIKKEIPEDIPEYHFENKIKEINILDLITEGKSCRFKRRSEKTGLTRRSFYRR